MKYLATIVLFFCFLQAYSQEAPADSTLTPFDLISNFYNGPDFNPFSKGNGYVGLAFTLEDQQFRNAQRVFDKVIDGGSIDYELTFKGGYFLWDYVHVGLNFSYGRRKFTGELVDSNSDSVQRQSIANQIGFTPNLKIYFPVSKNERLSFFMETGVGFGYVEQLVRETRDRDVIDKVESDEFIFSMGISPGITFFAIENFALEVQLNNLVGYEFSKKNTVSNDMDASTTTSNNVNFQINLLSLRLGLAYYFNKK